MKAQSVIKNPFIVHLFLLVVNRSEMISYELILYIFSKHIIIFWYCVFKVFCITIKPLIINFIDDNQIRKLNVIMKKHRVITLFLIQYLIKSQENT